MALIFMNAHLYIINTHFLCISDAWLVRQQLYWCNRQGGVQGSHVEGNHDGPGRHVYTKDGHQHVDESMPALESNDDEHIHAAHRDPVALGFNISMLRILAPTGNPSKGEETTCGYTGSSASTTHDVSCADLWCGGLRHSKWLFDIGIPQTQIGRTKNEGSRCPWPTLLPIPGPLLQHLMEDEEDPIRQVAWGRHNRHLRWGRRRHGHHDGVGGEFWHEQEGVGGGAL